MSRKRIKRILEIIPGAASWTIILVLLGLLILRPLVAAVVIIVYLLFWVSRLLYMMVLLFIAHRRIFSRRNVNWMDLVRSAEADLKPAEILHVVLYPVYREPASVLVESLSVLRESAFPRNQILVALAGEEREPGSREKLEGVRERFAADFRDVLVTIHPADREGEIPSKGSNATYAAVQVRKYLEKEGYDFGRVIISCFDADTCPDRNYFACLTYHFLTDPGRYQISYQPFPVYSNNIYRAPAFARVIEMGSTFWQLIESIRYEKFITFSSHSMSFRTLVEVGYWPVDMVSDDSLIFWKCFLKYNGRYRTFPLEVPVYMDIAVGKNWLDTVAIQYRQKRRWAWGVENFVFLAGEFLENREIPLSLKLRKLYQLLDNHVNWATWAIIITFLTPLVLYWGRISAKNALVLFNLSYLNSVVFNSLSLIIVLSVFMSRQFLPPRPANVSRFIHVSFVLQWLLLPAISAVLGSFPALDAQTRMMTGRYLGFTLTPKRRK